jgi:hypothetical protein
MEKARNENIVEYLNFQDSAILKSFQKKIQQENLKVRNATTRETAEGEADTENDDKAN